MLFRFDKQPNPRKFQQLNKQIKKVCEKLLKFQKAEKYNYREAYLAAISDGRQNISLIRAVLRAAQRDPDLELPCEWASLIPKNLKFIAQSDDWAEWFNHSGLLSEEFKTETDQRIERIQELKDFDRKLLAAVPSQRLTYEDDNYQFDQGGNYVG